MGSTSITTNYVNLSALLIEKFLPTDLDVGTLQLTISDTNVIALYDHNNNRLMPTTYDLDDGPSTNPLYSVTLFDRTFHALGLNPGAASVTLRYIGSNGVAVCSDTVQFRVLTAGLTAFRPTTELPAYGNPFDQHEVPDDQEVNPGAGIRENGDTETAANENDLIEVEIGVVPFPAPSGVKYFLRRSNSNISIWHNQTMGTPLLNSGTEKEFPMNSSPMSVWVECPTGGVSDLELIAKGSSGTELSTDKIHFYPFSSVVIIFEGEFGIPADPPQTGVSDLALSIFTNGYDVHLYEDPDTSDNPNAEDFALAEIVNAVSHRGVNSIAIIGYSHGGGSTFNISEDLDNNPASFNLDITAYIDAVAQPLAFQENRRPVNSAFHVNYYQEGDLFEDGGLDGGPIDPPGADFEVNVDDPVPTETHTTIDDDPVVHEGIRTRLYQQIDR